KPSNSGPKPSNGGPKLRNTWPGPWINGSRPRKARSNIFGRNWTRSGSNYPQRRVSQVSHARANVGTVMAKTTAPLVFLLCSAMGPVAPGAELKVLPSEMTLTGPQAGQRLIVLAETGGKVIGNLTDRAKFSSSNPTIAAVDEAGAVRAVGDGEAVITAAHGSQRATARVRVTKAKELFTPSFRNHVIPLLTKAG